MRAMRRQLRFSSAAKHDDEVHIHIQEASRQSIVQSPILSHPELSVIGLGGVYSQTKRECRGALFMKFL